MASYQYVFVMQNLTKVFPGGKELFKGITLSFLPGAKIGVLGVNGACLLYTSDAADER